MDGKHQEYARMMGANYVSQTDRKLYAKALGQGLCPDAHAIPDYAHDDYLASREALDKRANDVVDLFEKARTAVAFAIIATALPFGKEILPLMQGAGSSLLFVVGMACVIVSLLLSVIGLYLSHCAYRHLVLQLDADRLAGQGVKRAKVRVEQPGRAVPVINVFTIVLLSLGVCAIAGALLGALYNAPITEERMSKSTETKSGQPTGTAIVRPSSSSPSGNSSGGSAGGGKK